MDKLWDALLGRSILLWLGFALFSISAIGVGGMAVSVLVAQQVQGSGSAINVAGSLRQLSRWMGSLVLSEAENKVTDHRTLAETIAYFEASLNHPALRAAIDRNPHSDYARTYANVWEIWRGRLKPLLLKEAQPGVDTRTVGQHNALLAVIDAFVDRINTMVAQLQDNTEANVRLLRIILWAALALTLTVAAGGILILRRNVIRPLSDLVDNASRIAQGDFSARAGHVNRDELGQVGRSFNFMAEELSKLYRGLELRVAEKTTELTRSNLSLELLYHAIAHLHDAPVAPETYQSILVDLERALGLVGSMACLLPRHDGPATVLASTLGPCPDRGDEGCAQCIDPDTPWTPWSYQNRERFDLLTVPLRDAEHLYGVLHLALPAGNRLAPWQEQLLQALSRHIGIAMGISHRTEQERLLALQEERSIIARELHDSIAQALSYMKIQASLLQPALSNPDRRQEAETILGDLREGISAAYRQLRELLATFRLRMEGNFLSLLARTVEEYSRRGGLPIRLETRMGGCHLTPNQEIHTLQIIREALSNILRHAHATHAWVNIEHDADQVVASVEDDGVGLPPGGGSHAFHYGISIMRERADGLQGQVSLSPRPGGGTQVNLRFRTSDTDVPDPLPHQASTA